MNKDISKFNSSSKYIIYIKGVVIGIAVTILCVILFSGVMLLLEADKSLAAPFATVSVAAGTFFAAFYSARHIGDKGYIVGLIVGIFTFVVITLAALIINRNGLSFNTLFHFIIILLSSLIGGIVGVNKRKSRKFI